MENQLQRIINVGICDDEKLSLDIIAASVQQIFTSNRIEITLTTCLNAQEMLNCAQEKQFDILFLDNCMEKMDGIALGKKINALPNKPKIVFVSSNSDKVFKTFVANPFGFVRKERFLNELASVIERYIESLKVESNPIINLQLKEGNCLTTFNVTTLKYIECMRNAQILYMDGQGTQSIHSRMEVLEESLAPYFFLRIHKGFLVNCRYIKRFDTNKVTLTTGEELPIGRSKQTEAMNAYMDYVHSKGSTIIG